MTTFLLYLYTKNLFHFFFELFFFFFLLLICNLWFD
uniref:Uncharacterized protein n=1 Tax=Wuchereria bancrofti TaxID=6293 RepID=A0AAF5Q534_WUCBA